MTAVDPYGVYVTGDNPWDILRSAFRIPPGSWTFGAGEFTVVAFLPTGPVERSDIRI